MKISVCIPMYNESKIIADTAKTLYNYMSKNFGDDFEILFSNDGSLDGCDKIVEDLKLPNVRVVGYEKNRGKGCAVRCAILESVGDTVMFTDADLAYGVEVIGQAYEIMKKEKCDMLVGSRTLHKEGYEGYTFIRKLASKTYIKILSIAGGFKLSDSQCGFKAFRGDFARKVFSKCTTDGFAFDLEAILIANKMDAKTYEMPVKIINHRESKVNLFSDAFKMLRETQRIKKKVKNLQ